MLASEIRVLLYVEECCWGIYKNNSLFELVLSSKHTFAIFSHIFIGGRYDVL